jgi:hypothetical protein
MRISNLLICLFFALNPVISQTGLPPNSNVETTAISAYANPVTDELTITMPGYPFTDAVTLTVEDLVGKEIYKQVVISGKLVLNCAYLPCGAYVLKLQAKGGLLGQEKVIIL